MFGLIYVNLDDDFLHVYFLIQLDLLVVHMLILVVIDIFLFLVSKFNNIFENYQGIRYFIRTVFGIGTILAFDIVKVNGFVLVGSGN